jgi:hypothetical protein
MVIEPRPITPAEIDVVLTALRVASEVPVDTAAIVSVPNLRVVARCGCGCASVDFEHGGSSGRESTVIAEALGETATGRTVWVDVWARPDAITGLEISDEEPGLDELPIVSSLRSLRNDPSVIHIDTRLPPE